MMVYEPTKGEIEAAAIAFCQSGKFGYGLGRCAAICANLGHKPEKCEHAARVHGKLVSAALIAAASARPAYQQRADDWLIACFGEEIARDKTERNHRFLEEALEAVQSGGCTRSEAHQLVDYVFDRSVGELWQEVGGCMNTLAAFCLAHGLDMAECGERELARVWTKVEAIRAKQAAKPKHSPLPQETARPAPADVETMWQELVEKDDRTSPAEYPDMALITRDELAAMLRALAGERDAADERLAARIADYEEHRARLIAERDAAIAQRDAAQRQCEQWAATASEWALEKERLQDDAKHYDETRSIAVGTLRARLEQVTAERDAVSASLTRVEDERARLWTEKRDILGKLWIKQAAVETMKAKRDAALAQLAQAHDAINWACGCGPGEFVPPEWPYATYWWRNELVRKAGLRYDRDAERHVAALDAAKSEPISESVILSKEDTQRIGERDAMIDAASCAPPPVSDEVWDVVDEIFNNFGRTTRKQAAALITGLLEREREKARALVEALEPFANFGRDNVDRDGWKSRIHRESFSTWFGPSDFRTADAAIASYREGK